MARCQDKKVVLELERLLHSELMAAFGKSENRFVTIPGTDTDYLRFVSRMTFEAFVDIPLVADSTRASGIKPRITCIRYRNKHEMYASMAE